MLSDHLLKHHERNQNLRKTGNLKHLYRNKLDKVCFAHDAMYSDSKDLTQRTISSVVYKFFEKKTGLGVSASEQLSEELYKPAIKKFEQR